MDSIVLTARKTSGSYDSTDPVPDSPKGAIAGCFIVSFGDTMTDLNRQDVVHSTLFAQLAANAKFDRLSGTGRADWYNEYFRVLQVVGWIVTASVHNTSLDLQAGDTINNVVLRTLESLWSAEDLALFDTAVDAFERNQRANGIFDSQSQDDQQKADFQVGVSAQDKGNVVLQSVDFGYKIEPITQVFWYQLSPNLEHGKTSKLELNGQLYDQVREQVIEKLGDYTKSLIEYL